MALEREEALYQLAMEPASWKRNHCGRCGGSDKSICWRPRGK
jgi:hypothetical protein